MKIALTLTVLSAGLLLAADNPQVDASNRIRELHKEHIAALQQAADLLTAEYKNERRSYEELFQGRLRVLNAELDASEAGQDRIKLHESIVELMKDREAFLVQSLKLEKVDTLKVLNAKADRIKAEIALEEAKGNGVKRLK
jgi:hypothetical protein